MKSLLFLLASTLLVVIACGSSSTAKGNSATNACTLLTQAEVSAAVGAAVNAGVYEGTVVKRRAVLGSGTILNRSTPVYDLGALRSIAPEMTNHS